LQPHLSFEAQAKLAEHPCRGEIGRKYQADQPAQPMSANPFGDDRPGAFGSVTLAPAVGQETVADVDLLQVIQVFEPAESDQLSAALEDDYDSS
jgi:hypothetical protein